MIETLILPQKSRRTATWLLELTNDDIACLSKANKTLLRKETQEYIGRYGNIIDSSVIDNDAVQKLRTDRNRLVELTQKLLR